MTQLTIIGRLRAKAGREAALRGALLNVLSAGRAEADCLNYDLHVAADDPAKFVLYENWTGPNALERHFAQPHSRRFTELADALLAEPLAMERLIEISPFAGRRDPGSST